MKKLLPFLFFVISYPLLAQEMTWSINIAPSIAYRTFSYQDDQGNLPVTVVGEKPMHAFDFGIDMRTRLHKRMFIGAALLYAQKGFSNNYLTEVYQYEKAGTTYLIDYRQHHLDIPVFVTYHVIQKSALSFYAIAGMVNSILLDENNQVATKGNQSDPDILQALSRPYLQSASIHQAGLLGGFGITTTVNDKTQIGLEAQTKWMLTPLRDIRSSTNRYLYTVGLNFRFIRKLR